MPNHKHSSESIVLNGTAPLECLSQMKKFKTKHVPNTIPGYNVAVRNALRFHSRPFNVLYKRAEKYPAMSPMKTYNRIQDVIKAPRDEGDSIPIMATTAIEFKHFFPPNILECIDLVYTTIIIILTNCYQGHEKYLNTTTNNCGKKSWMFWWPKNVTYCCDI